MKAKTASLIHNPRCSKSREAKEILEKAGVSFLVIDYLKEGLDPKLLSRLPTLLGKPFKEMVREKEEIYEKLNLGEKSLNDAEWIKVLVEHPILLERPLFIFGDKAVIARPPELVKSLL